MREVTFGGQTFEVRALKRREVKQLKKDGFNLNFITPEQADDCMDRVFEMVFSMAELAAVDDLDQHEAIKLWNAVLRETYGAEDEEKNSLASGNGSPTKTA